jgi:hypothetical protein
MAYGDGGFFFTQRVGNGYSGVSYSAPPVRAQLQPGFLERFRRAPVRSLSERLRLVESQRRQVNRRIIKVSRMPTTSVQQGLLQNLQLQRDELTREINRIKKALARRKPKLPFLKIPQVSLPFLPSPPVEEPVYDLSDVQVDLGPTPMGMRVVENEMTIMDDSLEDEGLFSTLRNYAMDNPVVSLLIAGGLGYGGYRLYKRYRG